MQQYLGNINILSDEVSVILTDEVQFLGDSDSHGGYNTSLGIIWLDAAVAARFQKRWLFHEIYEYLLDMMGASYPAGHGHDTFMRITFILHSVCAELRELLFGGKLEQVINEKQRNAGQAGGEGQETP